MSIGGITFVIVTVFLIFTNSQAQHFIGQFEWFSTVVSIDYFSFYIYRLVNGSRVIVHSTLSLVLYALISSQQRHTQLALYHTSRCLSARRTRVGGRIWNQAIAQRRMRRRRINRTLRFALQRRQELAQRSTFRSSRTLLQLLRKRQRSL